MFLVYKQHSPAEVLEGVQEHLEQPQRAWEEPQSIRSDLRGSWKRSFSAPEVSGETHTARPPHLQPECRRFLQFPLRELSNAEALGSRFIPLITGTD